MGLDTLTEEVGKIYIRPSLMKKIGHGKAKQAKIYKITFVSPGIVLLSMFVTNIHGIWSQLRDGSCG